MKVKELREKLKNEVYGFDRVRVSPDGVVYVDRSYFYHHGLSKETLFGDVKKWFPTAELIDGGDNFRAWPKRSEVWVKFRIPEEKKDGNDKIQG